MTQDIRTTRGSTLFMRLNGTFVPQPTSTTKTKTKAQQGMVTDDIRDDDLYVFGAGECAIYNLGMVLNSEGEYVLIPGSIPSIAIGGFAPGDPLASEGAHFTPTTDAEFFAFFATLENAMLDDFQASVDDMPKRQRIAFASEDLFIDVIQKAGGSQKHTVIGAPDTRDLIRNILYGESETKAGGWSDDGTAGTLKLSRNVKSLRVESFGYFQSFDTGNLEWFKVTDTQDADGDVVVPALSKLEAIYLAPPLIMMSGQYRWRVRDLSASVISIGYGNGTYRLFDPTRRFEPPVPQEDLLFEFYNVEEAVAALLQQEYIDAGMAAEIVGYASAELAWLNSDPGAPPSITTRRPWSNVAFDHGVMLGFNYDSLETPAVAAKLNRLKAVLKTKSKTYYVWSQPGIAASERGLIIASGFTYSPIIAHPEGGSF